jgi:RNA polymerase-binding transcription factor DksA
MMNEHKREKFRSLLQDLSGRLRGDIQSLGDQTRTPTGGDAGGNLSNTPLHLADLGTSVYLQELNATLLENQEYIRDEVLHALRRIDDGTYGKCENCGRKIIEERLELLPYTRYCTACAEALQAGRDVNLNDGRQQSNTEILDPHDDDDATAYSGPAGGTVGGRIPGKIAPQPEPGDSPTGPQEGFSSRKRDREGRTRL